MTAIFIVSIVFGDLLVPLCRAEDIYQFLKQIPVGGEGGWDKLTMDETARRLYVTRESKIAVLDVDKEQIVGEITNTPGVHDFAVTPECPIGFSSNGQEASASVVDLKTLETRFKMKTGQNPDAILLEQSTMQVYVFNAGENTVTAAEADDGDFLEKIDLPGKPGYAVADSKAGKIFCNIENKNEVAVIDVRNHKVANHWPTAPGTTPSGMAIDPANHRLFIGCRNKLMVMIDSTNGNVLVTVPIGEGVGANAFDPTTQLAFSANGEGTVTIAHEDMPDKLTVMQTLKTERGARTMALDPKTHKIYLAAAQFESSPEAASGAPRQDPKTVPGSFKILVYGMKQNPVH